MAKMATALRGALLVLCACLSIGCSSKNSGPPSSREHVATQTEALNSVAVTLTVPNPVSPVSPVLQAVNEVELSGGSNVVSGSVVAMGNGGLEADLNALLNEAWSRGTAVLNLGVQVRGTLHASNVTRFPGVVVAATDTTPRLDPPSTLTWKVTYPGGSAPNVDVPHGGVQTIAPGLYGTVEIDAGATLNLSSGTYFLTTLNLESLGTVRLNQTRGPVVIYVNNLLILNGAFVVSGSDAGPVPEPDLLIGYLGNLTVFLNSTFDGAIVAPFTQVQILSTVGINKGFYAAHDVFLGVGASVQYRFPAAIVHASNPNGAQCQQLLADSGIPTNSTPLYCPLCSSPDDTDHDGVPDCVDACPYDNKKSKSPGICGCNIPDTDSDNDGIPDCIEPECSNDPNNTTPGQCGCVGGPYLAPAGTPCTDTACPQSGATCNGAGVCGNRSACNPCPPNGVFIARPGASYWICGEGLPPEVGGDGGTEHAGGGSPVSESTAQLTCSAKGLTLSRIHTVEENRLFASLLTTPIWLGANDLTTSGQWRWSTPNSNNGELFWVGGPTGTVQNNLYSNWGAAAPGSARCASMTPGDGLWFDTNCSETLGYVCGFQPPAPGLPPDAGNGGWGNGGGGGGVDQPVPMPNTACVPEFGTDAGGLPDSMAELINEVQLARADAAFIGVAANRPPPGSTCPSEGPDARASENIGLVPDSGAGCFFTNSRQIFSDGAAGDTPDGGPGFVDCMQDTDCAQFGADYVCRTLKNNPGCTPPDGGDAAAVLDASFSCPGHSVCMQLVCPPVSNVPCREVQICTTGTAFDAAPDPSTNMDAGAFDPATMFGGKLPDASPSPAYVDPPDGSGPNHTWCHMVPQNPVANAKQPAGNTGGSSGHGTKINFAFDPNLEFTANANPLAFGENQMDVHAAATLRATVQLSGFLGQNYSADIVDIGAGIRAQRCSVDNDETQFTVLGVDALALIGIGIPKFDSAKFAPSETQTCNDAVGNFILWSNRAKKAFRDAQQLLSQYQGAKDAGARLAGTLCHDIIDSVSANNIEFFPGGLNCPDGEPAEMTINRFLEYLQAPGYGQISQLRNAAMGLTTATSNMITSGIDKLKVSIRDSQRDESQTILNVPFAIGPVPMVLQVDVFATYGINGEFAPDVHLPFSKLAGLDDTNTSNTTPFELAHVKVEVAPFASAGISAFVGAGVDLGAFSATVGIEGRVTLGQIEAPIYAGAGLDMLMQSDPRQLPSDIASVSVPGTGTSLGSLFHFGVPKSFNFMVWYEYGAGVQLSNILAGEIDGRLHIEFFFFSADWRVQIVRFNGWSKYFNLVSGGSGPSTRSTSQSSLGTKFLPAPDGSTTVVSPTTQGPSMGLAESQLPLTVLQSLQPAFFASDAGDDGGDAGDAGLLPDVRTIPLDKSAVQSFFYDDLCCVKGGATCSRVGTPQCCPDFTCQLADAGAATGTCVQSCVNTGGVCKQDAAVGCCPGLFCSSGTCVQACIPQGQACVETGCCPPFECINNADGGGASCQ